MYEHCSRESQGATDRFDDPDIRAALAIEYADADDFTIKGRTFRKTLLPKSCKAISEAVDLIGTMPYRELGPETAPTLDDCAAAVIAIRTAVKGGDTGAIHRARKVAKAAIEPLRLPKVARAVYGTILDDCLAGKSGICERGLRSTNGNESDSLAAKSKSKPRATAYAIINDRREVVKSI